MASTNKSHLSVFQANLNFQALVKEQLKKQKRSLKCPKFLYNKLI